MNPTIDILAALDDIDALAAKATEGPWKLWVMEVQTDRDGIGEPKDESLIAHTADPDCSMRTFNARFIAAARDGWPATVAALRVAVQALEAYADPRLTNSAASRTKSSSTYVGGGAGNRGHATGGRHVSAAQITAAALAEQWRARD